MKHFKMYFSDLLHLQVIIILNKTFCRISVCVCFPDELQVQIYGGGGVQFCLLLKNNIIYTTQKN